MGRYRLRALVGAAFLLPLSAGAWAADLPEIPPYQPPVEVGHSWYLRGDIGMTNQSVGSLYNVLYDTRRRDQCLQELRVVAAVAASASATGTAITCAST